MKDQVWLLKADTIKGEEYHIVLTGYPDAVRLRSHFYETGKYDINDVEIFAPEEVWGTFSDNG